MVGKEKWLWIERPVIFDLLKYVINLNIVSTLKMFSVLFTRYNLEVVQPSTNDWSFLYRKMSALTPEVNEETDTLD